MRTIKKWLRQKIQYWLWEDDDEIQVQRGGRVLESESIRIDIYRGAGGLAIETIVYNKKRDENVVGFHIVHDDENLGHNLSKIITAESLKAL